MATLKAYPLGVSCGLGNPAPTGGKRGEIQGWSRGAARRNTEFLYSIDVDRLDGNGDAVTLTLRDIPATHEDWQRLVKNLFQRIRRMDLLIRWHYVTEWQRRGAPHLHIAVYSRSADKGHYVNIRRRGSGAPSPLGLTSPGEEIPEQRQQR